MVILVRLFGICIAVMGIVFFTKKDALKKYIEFWKDKKKIKSGGILAIAIGIIFLIADSECRIPLLITILGIWSVVKGVLLLTLRQKKIETYLDWWLEKPAKTTRFLGVFALVFGVVLIYAA